MRPSIVLLCVGIGLLGGVAVLMVLRATHEAPASVDSASPEQGSIEQPTDHDQVVAAPDRREVGSVEPDTDALPEVQWTSQTTPTAPIPVETPPVDDAQVVRPPELGRREPVPASVFEDKYRGNSTEELAAAKERVTAEFVAAKKAAFKARFQAGLYEVHVMDPNKPFRFEATAGDPLCGFYTPANSNEQHMTVLPFDEYPELYALMDEQGWLASQVK